MKVYISSHDREQAIELAESLTVAGHTVVSTWHALPKLPRHDADAWGKAALNNFREIEGADALTLQACDEFVPGGKFVEAGYALRAGVTVYTVGGSENALLQHHPKVRHVADTAALLAAIGTTP